MFRAEMLKLKRAQLWVVIVVLPVLAAITGTVNTTANSGVISQNWDGLMSQITLFYGLFYCAIGVAIIVAAGWRMEHSGNNWIQVHTTTSNYFKFMLAKIGALLIPVLGMNLLLLACVVIGGKFAMSLPGLPSANTFTVIGMTVAMAAPVVALQSMFSIWMKSFAAPIGIGVLGSIVGVGFAFRLPTLALLFPYSLLTNGILLGSLAVGESIADAATVTRMLAAAACITLALAAFGAYSLRRRKGAAL